jgi:hypothetical protein
MKVKLLNTIRYSISPVSQFLTNRIFLSVVILLHLISCSPDLPQDVSHEYALLPDKVDYNIHVKPVLSDKCFACHGPDRAKQKAGLRLDIASIAYGDLPEHPGKTAIDPGSLNGSEVFHRIMSDDPEYRMPSEKSHLTLSPKEKAVLIKWIEQGAVYKPHWAFEKPEMPTVPAVDRKYRIINPIDNFILHRLQSENMEASVRADKEVLLRRVSLDLTGLNPTLEEIDSFIKDDSQDAYEKQVDRLLASPHFGEKMAVDWLDLARFSDSHGYTVDRILDMSPYRDWVINSFNANLPYDKFIQWQLAGDLMPSPTKEMVMATAFNRIHQQNTEGGIIEEEFRTEYVVDRINTTGVAIMGLPVGCARCHDHKYDPISQKNYYELFSFFNNVKEAGQISFNDAMPSPTLLLPSAEKEKIIQYIKEKITSDEQRIVEAEQAEEDNFNEWLSATGYRQLSNERIPAKGLQAHYDFDQGLLVNKAKPTEAGMMKRGLSPVPGDKPVYISHDTGKALALNGDEWFDLGKTGAFRKSDPFTISIRIMVPKEFNEGVIFHKCVAERLYNYRGYHLYIRDNKLELSMAHTAPSDAITKISKSSLPRDQWLQFTFTYDGSGKASGLKLFQDGIELEMITTMDQLAKDILLDYKEQPGLQVGAWDRGYGLKDGKVDDILVYNRALTEFEVQVLAGRSQWSLITMKAPQQLTDDEKSTLRKYYMANVNKTLLDMNDGLKKKRAELADSTENIQEYMIMQEMPEPRQAYLLKRGNYDELGEEVFPNTPESILPFPKELPKNRYGLAQWLTDADHPLTARVAVNRYWQNFFGTGLVKTSEDFGNQGEMPSHPELLDWLAVTFCESGWDIKKMCKLMVMSATYCQSSMASTTNRERDPENRLLSRGPSVRLSAEMIRDNALLASGLLNKKIGGKSVKPYQPDGLWEINNTSYKADAGDGVYRRSVYVLIKRSVPNPTLATFDATSRSYCVSRRQQTNTPLQALVTLNDPTYVEATKVLGEQMTLSSDPSQAIVVAYRKLTGRTPSSEELDLLNRLRANELEKFRKEKGKSKGLLAAGQYQMNKHVDPALVAANAVVASVILNSDATLMKR